MVCMEVEQAASLGLIHSSLPPAQRCLLWMTSRTHTKKKSPTEQCLHVSTTMDSDPTGESKFAHLLTSNSISVSTWRFFPLEFNWHVTCPTGGVKLYRNTPWLQSEHLSSPLIARLGNYCWSLRVSDPISRKQVIRRPAKTTISAVYIAVGYPVIFFLIVT